MGAPARSELFSAAVETIRALLPRAGASHPTLYAADGSPIVPHQTNQYERRSASYKGSLRTWKPRLLVNDEHFARQRELIADRASDLIESDPLAASAPETISTLVVGTGLNPYPLIDWETANLGKERARQLSDLARGIWRRWGPHADASGRMPIEGIQFQVLRNVVHWGEFFALVHMINDPARPYSLAIRLLNPTRVFTPSDLINRGDIKDGIEIGRYGQPVACWVQLANASAANWTSKNFVRIPMKAGHRFRVIHGFIGTDPEQVRGISLLSPAMKMFRDNSDYFDAELVSNVITAAVALFVETGAVDPYAEAAKLATLTDTGYKSDNSTYDQRYQELIPGAIMYGSTGQKPHLLSAQRPSVTFEPFTRSLRKVLANSLGFPAPVLWRDFDEMNYASYRSAMLEAWRVVKQRRRWMGSILCAPIYRMLLEEAYLRGKFDVPDFYENMHELTDAEWIGPPKGQIEPEKEVKADILQIQHNLKSREEVAIENNRDQRATFDQLEDEQDEMEKRGLNELKVGDPAMADLPAGDNGDAAN